MVMHTLHQQTIVNQHEVQYEIHNHKSNILYYHTNTIPANGR